MDPYNPAKYPLRAPPPIPPRPGTVPYSSNEPPAPPLPPRRPSSIVAAPSFPPPPPRPAQQSLPYQQAYNRAQYAPPPALTQSTYNQASPPQSTIPPPQQNIPPPPSYHAPHYDAPPTESTSPPVEYHGAPAPGQRYTNYQQPAQPASYQPPPASPYPSTSPNQSAPGDHVAPAQPAVPQPVSQTSYYQPQAPTYAPPASTQAEDYAVNAGSAHRYYLPEQGSAQPPSYDPPATYPPPPPPPRNRPVGAHQEAPVDATHYPKAQHEPTLPGSYDNVATPVCPPPPKRKTEDYGTQTGGVNGGNRNSHYSVQASHYSPQPPATSQPSYPTQGDHHAPRPEKGDSQTYTATHASPMPPSSGSGGGVQAVPATASLGQNYAPRVETPLRPQQIPAPTEFAARIAGLTEAISQTHIDPGRTAPAAQTAQPRPHKPARPPIQYDPPAKFTLRQCPSTVYILTGETPWYIHPDVPDFRICTYCYEKHIQYTQLADAFKCISVPGGSKPQCLFSCPRIEDDIWPRMVQTRNNLQELLQFFAHRLRVPNCSLQRGVSPSEGIKWYRPRDTSRFPDFLACQACYEDVLLAGPLRDEFMLFTGSQPEGTLFICDAHNSFIRRMATKTASMETFISESIRHLHLPECEKSGALVDGRSRTWYYVPNSPSITVCERCYREFALRTEFEHALQPVSSPGAQQRCMLGMWQSRSVWSEALALHDFALWERTALEVLRTPACTLEIPSGTPIYQIQGVDNFDVCHSCYTGLLKPHGLDQFFHRLPTPCTGQSACDLNAGTPRFPLFAYKLDEALITAAFSTFTTFATRLAPLDTCPKLNGATARRWYGTETCRICPTCYEEIVRDSFLATSGIFPDTSVTLPTETDCDLYSARMRSKFASACAARDPSAFLSFAAHRKTIHAQTVPEMRALVARAKQSAAMQRMYNTASSAYNNLDGISQVGMVDYGWRYSAPGVGGGFRTHWGVEGAAMGQAGVGYLQQVQVDANRVRYLQGVWDAVE
ncbi:hypothetical protein BJY01DRAFT_250563 [Aspergillus pseudoustus]|uniref:Integral membrane protein n=1 Tax=Aspergillus pseudoustus TaxID=1810923 RepID=A0ABR4JGS5_9EURO